MDILNPGKLTAQYKDRARYTMYKKETMFSRKFRDMREEKQRRRGNYPASEAPPELPRLRRRIIVVNYDSGVPIRFCVDLYKTNRVDCYRAAANGKSVERQSRMGEGRRSSEEKFHSGW